MENIVYLVAGYLVVWGGLFLYLWRILVLQKGLVKRLAVLEATRIFPMGQKGNEHE
jgi:CcmD family protein